MKLFKKLAAAVLVAALALTMVGCGAGGTGSAIDLKNEVLNVIEDSYCADHKRPTRLPWMRQRLRSLRRLQRMKQQKTMMLR